MLIADDDNIFLVIKANGKGITGFRHDKKSQEGIQYRLNTEEKDTDGQQPQIENKASSANTDGIMLLDDSADNIRATTGAAHPVHTRSANAIKHTACDTS